MKMGDFRATIVHASQTVIMLRQTCGKCLQDNHRTMECMNGWVCKRCLVSGHKSGDCPMTSDMTQNEEITVQAEPVVEPEPERRLFTQVKQLLCGGKHAENAFRTITVLWNV